MQWCVSGFMVGQEVWAGVCWFQSFFIPPVAGVNGEGSGDISLKPHLKGSRSRGFLLSVTS